jgi:hypothetical protein
MFLIELRQHVKNFVVPDRPSTASPLSVMFFGTGFGVVCIIASVYSVLEVYQVVALDENIFSTGFITTVSMNSVLAVTTSYLRCCNNSTESFFQPSRS